MDGGTGKVYAGQAALVAPELTGNFHRLMGWADGIRQLRVRVNADTPADAHRGRDFGAEGIGLCRTEHMFFEGDRINAMREMILAQDAAGRKRALAKLLPMQRADFEGIFRAMEGYPGHHPAAGSAAARVPAQGAGGDRGAGPRDGQDRRGGPPRHRALPR